MNTNPYLQTEAETLTPGQLLLKAYKDIFDLIEEAETAIKNNDIMTKAKALSKASRIINVLKAEMSLIGPRPYMLNEEKKTRG